MVGSSLHLLLEGELERPLAAGRVKAFLRHFPAYIGMRRFTEPMVLETVSGCCGIVGIVGLEESHISIHVQRRLELSSLIWVDVFSCVHFDTEVAIRGLVQLLGIGQHSVRVIPRPMPVYPPLEMARTHFSAVKSL